MVDELTVWELAVCVDGYNKANGAEPPLRAPTDAEFEAMLLWGSEPSSAIH